MILEKSGISMTFKSPSEIAYYKSIGYTEVVEEVVEETKTEEVPEVAKKK